MISMQSLKQDSKYRILGIYRIGVFTYRISDIWGDIGDMCKYQASISDNI